MLYHIFTIKPYISTNAIYLCCVILHNTVNKICLFNKCLLFLQDLLIKLYLVIKSGGFVNKQKKKVY